MATAERWHLELERAHRLAHEAARAVQAQLEPSPHLSPAATQLSSGVEAIYAAFNGTTDRATAINQGHTRLWAGAILIAQENAQATADLSGALGALRQACQALLEAERSLGPSATRLTPRPHRAGGTELTLHAPHRKPVAPKFMAPPLPDAPTEAPAEVLPAVPTPDSFEALAAAAAAVNAFAQAKTAAALAPKTTEPEPSPEPDVVPDGFARAPDPAVDAETFSRRWLRECIDEVGMLGLQRAPLPGDAWRDVMPLEVRMVRAIDAAIAFGADAACEAAEALAHDAPVADPMRMFAVTAIGGCIEGRDTLGPAERVLTRYGMGDPAIARAFVDAMKVVPHPDAARLLRSWLDGPRRALAVDVMAHRGWLTEAEMGRVLEEGSPAERAWVLPAMARARYAGLGRALTEALADDAPVVVDAALHAKTIAAHADTTAAAEAAQRGPLGDRALLWMALSGGRPEAQSIVGRLAQPSPDVVRAAGWAGALEAVGPLIGLLADDALAPVAAEALERLLGAGLTQTTTVSPDALVEPYLFDPDPDPKPERPPLDDGRDPFPEGTPEDVEVPSTDAAAWRAHWQAHRSAIDLAARHRLGQPYSTSVSLHALDQRRLGPDDRRCLQAELCFRTGRIVPWSPEDFVTAQHRSLHAWAEVLARDPGTPGAW